METVWTVLLAAGIPSAVAGILIGRLTRQIALRDKAREDKEAARLQHEVLTVKLIMAAINLGEATAEAVERIPDAHCNGDMHEALEYARCAKDEYREFERTQTMKAIK